MYFKPTSNRLQVSIADNENDHLDITEDGKIIIKDLDLLLAQALRQQYTHYNIGLGNTMKLDRYVTFSYGFDEYMLGIPIAGTSSFTIADNKGQLQAGPPLSGGLSAVTALSVYNVYGGMAKMCDVRFSCAMNVEPLTISTIGIGGVHNGINLYNGVTGESSVNVYYGGRSHIVEFTFTAAETTAQTATITLDGIPYTVPLTNATGDVNFHAYECTKVNFQPWLVDQAGPVVTFTYGADGPHSGTYSYSSTGVSTGTFSEKALGVTRTNEYIAQADWVNDGFDLSIENEYIIRWSFSGHISYEVYHHSLEDHSYELIVQGFIYPPVIPQMQFDATLISVDPVNTHTMDVFTMSYWYENGVDYFSSPIIDVVEGISVSAIAAPNEAVLQNYRNRFEVNGYRNYMSFNGTIGNVITDGTKPVRIFLSSPITLGDDTPSNYPDYMPQDLNTVNPLGTCDLTKLTTCEINPLLTQRVYELSKAENFFFTLDPFSVILPPGGSALWAANMQSGSSTLEIVFNGGLMI